MKILRRPGSPWENGYNESLNGKLRDELLNGEIFPVILKQSARVESPCPVSSVIVQLTVTLDGVKDLEPASTVVSIVIPKASEACCDVRGAFCNQVHFFRSSEEASAWLAGHPGAMIFTVDEAYQLGRTLIEHLFKDEKNE
jgi:alkylmercury lyase